MSDHLGDIFTSYSRDLSKGRHAQTRLLPGPRLADVPTSEQDTSPPSLTSTPATLCAVPLSPRAQLVRGHHCWADTMERPSWEVSAVSRSWAAAGAGGWGCAEGPLGGISACDSGAGISARWRVTGGAQILPPTLGKQGKVLRQEKNLCSRKIL